MDTLNRMLYLNKIRLPSPPGVALRLLETVRREHFSFGELADVIQHDPALTARVLKVVNSAYYSLPDKIGNVERALAVLGVNAVKNIAFSFTLVDGLKTEASGIFDMDYFWKRSIIAAIGTELFTQHLGLADEDLYVSALLQDLGILVLYSNFPDEYSRLIAEKNRTRVPIQVLEMEKFGFTHQELCSHVLGQWGLPEEIHVPIGHHHHYRDAPESCRGAARILFLSNALSSIYSDTESYDKIRHFSDIITQDLGISDGTLEALVDRGVGRVVEICSQFQIPSGDIKPLAVLLQEANEGLSDLNLSYGKLLEEYRKEKLQAETLARELGRANEKLHEANLKLKELAEHDPLTGLHNRRYLFDNLERELDRVRRCGERLAIMLFDVDHFKLVNDTHGHQTGDLVLRAVGEAAARITRSTDLLARYGGEEFVMVMPETELRGAAAIAERLRKGIEEMEISHEGQTIRVTVSIGIAACGPGGDPTSARLFRLADHALYQAKEGGRNRVATAHGDPRAITGSGAPRPTG